MDRRNLLRTASVLALGGFVAACQPVSPGPTPGPTPNPPAPPDPSLSRAQQIVAAIASAVPILVQLATSVAGVPAATAAKWQALAQQVATTAQNILAATSTVAAGHWVELFETALRALLTDLGNSTGLLPTDATAVIRTINGLLPVLLGIFNLFVPGARRADATPVDVNAAIAQLNGFAQRRGLR